jgi:catechol 2,3-dioxygenase-like lactoylglutathione lyase family enzyme
MKIVHTMIRVNDLDESLKFYCDGLGMKLLKRRDYESGRFTNVFVGYGAEETEAVIELTYNWDTHKYDLGNGFGHIALGVPDVSSETDGDPRSRRAAENHRRICWSGELADIRAEHRKNDERAGLARAGTDAGVRRIYRRIARGITGANPRQELQRRSGTSDYRSCG